MLDLTPTLFIRWTTTVCVAESYASLRITLTFICTLHAKSFFIAVEYDTNFSN